MSSTLTVLYFAALRERLKLHSELVPLSELGTTPDVAALWRWLEQRHPQLSSWRSHLRLAVNQDFADDDHPIKADDEIALIPPVSGGQDQHLADASGCFVMTTKSIDAQTTEALVARTQAGAVVSFTGRVRDHTDDHQVDYLIYEAYPQMALKKLEQSAQEAHQQWPQLTIAIHHRYGRLELGEIAVAISVSSPHRAEAFMACQYLIDRLKEIVPIWKKEVGPDGQEWIGFGP